MMPLEPDHYAVLELAPGSPMEEVKSQYRRLAKRYHPDLHGNDARSQEKFRRINAAYTFLSDASRKAAYDARLQAARKRAAAFPRPAPTLRPSSPPRPTPPTTGYQALRTATGYHERIPATLRMTRSAWLGATAGVIVVLLLFGLSFDGADRPRPAPGEVAVPVAGERLPLGTVGNGSGANGSEEDSSEANGSASGDDAGSSQAQPPSLPVPSPIGVPGRVDAVPDFRPASIGPTPSFSAGNSADSLKSRLLARYRAALPRADRLIEQGDAARASHSDAVDGSRRILRDQLAADLEDLSATRARIPPAIARLSPQNTSEDLQAESGPILTDIQRLENSRQSVQADLHALSVPASSSGVSSARVSSVVSSSAPRVRPPAFSRTPSASSVPTPPALPAAPIPATRPLTAPAPRQVSLHPVLPSPVPATPAPHPASAAPAAPTPPDKTAAKPKASSGSGQEFIMWGK